MYIKTRKIILAVAITLPWETNPHTGDSGEPIEEIHMDEKNSRFSAFLAENGNLLIVSPDGTQGIKIPGSLIISYGELSDVIPHVLPTGNGRIGGPV